MKAWGAGSKTLFSQKCQPISLGGVMGFCTPPFLAFQKRGALTDFFLSANISKSYMNILANGTILESCDISLSTDNHMTAVSLIERKWRN